MACKPRYQPGHCDNLSGTMRHFRRKQGKTTGIIPCYRRKTRPDLILVKAEGSKNLTVRPIIATKEGPMRLTTRTNLALRTLMVCAVNTDRIVRKTDVAQAINASENHLAQVVNQLGQAGFLTTLRGRHGGFTLARPATEISVGDVFRTFEADLPLIECFSAENTCPLKDHCRMAGHLAHAIESFYSVLDPVMLGDLVDCNAGLDALLALDNPLRGVACVRARQSRAA